MVTTSIPTELQIRDAIASLREILAIRSNIEPNKWAYFSHRNRTLNTAQGDLVFANCILLEGDSSVNGYNLSPALASFEQSASFLKYNKKIIQIFYKDGREELRVCCYADSEERLQIDLNSLTAGKINTETSPCLKFSTEQELETKTYEILNWLMLCGAMTRARDFDNTKEVNMLNGALSRFQSITFADAMKLPGSDPALILSAVAHGLANGLLFCELRSSLLSLSSRIMYKEVSHEFSSQRPNTVRSAQEIDCPRKFRNRRTNRIPEQFIDLNDWPTPQKDLVADPSYSIKKVAVSMYFANESYDKIYATTRLSASWVRKLAGKCLTRRSDGSIWGFAALIRYTHTTPYKRHLPPPHENNQYEASKGGYSGSFMQLLAEHPDIVNMIEDSVLKNRIEIHPRWVDLHAAVTKLLKRSGVRADSYPFNTADQLYTSLTTFCRSFLCTDPMKWIERRFGREAARRTRVGSGVPSLLRSQWSFQIVEMDFARRDAAGVVIVDTPKKGVLEVPVSRWWAGMALETYLDLIIGTSDSFMAQTTEECVLELVGHTIAPQHPEESLMRYEETPDGRWLPNQLNSEIAWNGWDVLKLDQAWAHKATTVVAAIVSTIGCAVCYGERRAWWRRHAVESMQGKTAESGDHRLVSTYGTGPMDKKRSNPTEAAKTFGVREEDLCNAHKKTVRWLNDKCNAANFSYSPNELLGVALTNGEGIFFPRPLPLARREDHPFMWKTIPCVIKGDARSGKAPYIEIGPDIFHGTQLQSAWSQIGKNAFLQVDIHDMRIARAVIAETGLSLGSVFPALKWTIARVSWRDHLIINKFAKIRTRQLRHTPPVSEFLHQHAEEIEKSTSSSKNRKFAASKARDYANVKRNAKDKDSSSTSYQNSASIRPSEELPFKPLQAIGTAPKVETFSLAPDGRGRHGRR